MTTQFICQLPPKTQAIIYKRLRRAGLNRLQALEAMNNRLASLEGLPLEGLPGVD